MVITFTSIKVQNMYRNFNLSFTTIVTIFMLFTNTCFAVTKNQPAPAFQLPDIKTQKMVSLEQYKGKVVYIDFWASWCGPCRKSFPLMDKLQKELGNEQFQIIGINLDQKMQEATDFLHKYPVSFVIAADPEGKTPEIYGVQGMPSSYLIDKKGRVRWVHKGFKSSDIEKIKKGVKKLLAEK